MICKSLEARFWDNILKTDGCWLWQGTKCATEGFTYGQAWHEGKRWKAHRLSWLLHKGAIPARMCICHTCDNPLCVNPDHLFLGTQGDNNTDRHNKGRDGAAYGEHNGSHTHPESRPRGERHYSHTHPESRRGEANGRARLRTRDVVDIRRMQGIAQRRIAKIYGISKSQVGNILRGESWNHVN